LTKLYGKGENWPEHQPAPVQVIQIRIRVWVQELFRRIIRRIFPVAALFSAEVWDLWSLPVVVEFCLLETICTKLHKLSDWCCAGSDYAIALFTTIMQLLQLYFVWFCFGCLSYKL